MVDQQGVSAGPPVAGFWRRLAAYLIDLLILAIPCAVLGFFFFAPLAAIGGYGRLIGLVVAIGYFGVLNSRIGGGRTIGKGAMGIQVVDAGGMPLATGASFLRATVLLTPFFLNGVFFRVGSSLLTPVAMVMGGLAIIAVFGGTLAIVYLAVFNRRTRQSLHDLAVGSFVVRRPSRITPGVPLIHRLVLGCILVLALLLPIGVVVFGKMIAGPDMTEALAAVQALPEVSSSQVMNLSVRWSNREPAEQLIIGVSLRSRPVDGEQELDRIAQAALAASPVGASRMVTVSAAYGVDLGLFRWSYGYTKSRQAGEWRMRGARSSAATTFQ